MRVVYAETRCEDGGKVGCWLGRIFEFTQRQDLPVTPMSDRTPPFLNFANSFSAHTCTCIGLLSKGSISRTSPRKFDKWEQKYNVVTQFINQRNNTRQVGAASRGLINGWGLYVYLDFGLRPAKLYVVLNYWEKSGDVLPDCFVLAEGSCITVLANRNILIGRLRVTICEPIHPYNLK